MNEQQPTDGLPTISVDDLIRMIGDAQVTIQRQGLLIARQNARLTELEQGEKSSVTTTAFDTSTMASSTQ